MAALLGFTMLACGGDDDNNADSSTENDSGDSGDSGGGGDRQKLIDALSGSESSSGEFTDEEVECMVPGMVDAIGVEALMEAGAVDNPDADLAELGLDLDEEQAGKLFDSMNDCVDLREAFTEGATGDGTTAEQAQCLTDNIDDATFRQLMVTVLVEGEDALAQDQELIAAITEATTACMATGG
jgi:hypothetical protein